MTGRAALTRKRPAGRRVPAASLAVGLALGVLASCGADDDGPSGTPPAAGPTTATTEPTSTAPAPSPAAEDTATRDDACLVAQVRAVKRLRTWKAVGAVTSSETGVSAAAARWVREDAGRAAAEVEAACGNLPAPTRRYVRDLRRPTAAGLGHAQLDEVLAAWLRWGKAVDLEQPAERAIRELQACRGLMRDLSVSHRVWWRWTATGRAWWVELTWDNRTGRTVSGELFGEVRVTGLLPDRFGWSASAASAGPGRTGTEGWGGSSADGAWVRPGVSRQVLAPGADQDVHTTEDGTFTVTDNTVFLYVPGPGLNTCLLPVPEES